MKLKRARQARARDGNISLRSEQVKLTEHGACQILGLAAPTTKAEARSAYRALARELHPDAGGDEERFKQVSAAYQYLTEYYEDNPRRERSGSSSRPEDSRQERPRREKSSARAHTAKRSAKRKSTKQSHTEHDSSDHRAAWRTWREQFEREASEFNAQEDESSDTSSEGSRSEDSGRARRHQAPPRSSGSQSSQGASRRSSSTHSQEGDLVEAEVLPSWGDAIRRWGGVAGEKARELKGTTEHKLKLFYRRLSPRFEAGSNQKLKLMIDTQTVLHGKRHRIAIQRAEPCPRCQMREGALRVNPDESAAMWAEGCQECGGEGRVERRQELSVDVPPGGDHKHQLKVPNRGTAGLNGATDGDLILILAPEELPRGFSRRGAQLDLLQGVSAQLLKTGGVLPVKTLRGQVRIKVPSNFRSGGKLVIAGEGLPTWNAPEQVGSLTVCLRAIT